MEQRAGSFSPQAGPVNDQMLSADAGESWLHANGNWAAHRYSTLTNLNVSKPAQEMTEEQLLEIAAQGVPSKSVVAKEKLN